VKDGSTSLTVCNAEHVCVACTGLDYAACGKDGQEHQRVCNSLTQQCSQQTEQSQGLCAACDSDAACGRGQRCAQQRFGGQAVGYFCFWEQGAEGGPTGCRTARPYVQTQANAASIDGHVGTLCVLRSTTCPALSQFSTEQGSCGNSNDDQACGVSGLDDALCRQFDATSYGCTVPCGSSDDCVSGFSCNTTASPRYCDLQANTCYVNADCAQGQTCNTALHQCQ
jgi:hypothetical protein